MGRPAATIIVSFQRERLIVILILAAFAILLINFNLGPSLEGSDGLEHY